MCCYLIKLLDLPKSLTDYSKKNLLEEETLHLIILIYETITFTKSKTYAHIILLNIYLQSLFQLLRMRFSAAYYLCKKERPYIDYADLLALEEKNDMKVTKGYKTNWAAANFVYVIGQLMKDSLAASYYSLLTDGSTDTSILEQ